MQMCSTFLTSLVASRVLVAGLFMNRALGSRNNAVHTQNKNQVTFNIFYI